MPRLETSWQLVRNRLSSVHIKLIVSCQFNFFDASCSIWELISSWIYHWADIRHCLRKCPREAHTLSLCQQAFGFFSTDLPRGSMGYPFLWIGWEGVLHIGHQRLPQLFLQLRRLSYRYRAPPLLLLIFEHWWLTGESGFRWGSLSASLTAL